MSAAALKKYSLISGPFFCKKTALLAIALLVVFSGICQTRIGRLNELSLKKEVPFTVTQFSTRDGLTQSQIIEIVENSDGSLFLSTANGVNTFNGYEFSEIEIDKRYRYYFWEHLYWSRKYQMLYGKDFNTSRIIKLQPEFKPVSPPEYAFIYSASYNDTMFLADNMNRLYMSLLPDFKITALNCRIPGKMICMTCYKQLIYCSTETGLYTYNIRTKELKKIAGEKYTRFKVNPYSQQLYGLTVSTVNIMGDTIRRIMSIDVKGLAKVCKDIAFINESEFYVGTTQGLYYYNPEYTSRYGYAQGLVSESINSLFYNKDENCLLAGTGEKGLMKLQFKNAYSFYTAEGLPSSSLNSIIRTADGKVLFSENCCHIHRLLVDTVINYNPSEEEYSSLAEINNQLYCGTWGNGIQIMEGDKVVGNINYPSLPGTVAYGAFRDRSGGIWIATDKGLAKGNSPQTIRPFLTSAVKGKVNCIYELRNGDICIGGETGFYIVSGDKLSKAIGKAQGLNAKEVRSFLEDEEGKLWVGTYGGGIYCYEKGVLTSVNAMENCMLFEDAFCLAMDDYGQIFMTSNFGLWKISYKALNDFYRKRTSFLVPEHYTQESGILNTEFNGGFQNNFLKSANNHFYFPTVEGIVVVRPDTPSFHRLMPKIGLATEQGFVNNDQQRIFDRNISVVSFKAGCVNFSEKFNTYFQYKILNENEESDWSAPQKENVFSFYQLSPGNYRFVIRVIDSNNDPHPAEQVFSFHILPYFYETTWFRVLVLLLIAVSTVLIIRWRTRKNREQLEKENAVKRQLAELQLEGIQAQMNPHFVFNSLNTIQALFITGQTKLANEYTSKFSSLMRIIIEHIRKRKISIREEMVLLETYLPLENMQLENEFEFSITVEPGIDKDNTFIHGMIIHTFVENAIKHGIKPVSDRKGIIRINFRKEPGNIVVEIMDNGNGINHAVKKGNGGKHISRGLQIIKERINIINLLENVNIYTETVDLKDLDNTQTGTLVKIIYPIIYDTNADS